MVDPVLSLEKVSTHFFTSRGVARAVADLDLELASGETLGLIGEGGSGKSVVGWTALGLVPPPGRIVDGTIRFRGQDLRTASDEDLRRIRGNDIAIIVQNARAHLNPIVRVGDQIANVYRSHHAVSKRAALEKAAEMLSRVAIPDPGGRIRSFPHELSGGMAQRVLIAMATVNDPAVLIADEPTMGLDVTIQAQILDLMRQRVRELGAAALLITRDLGVVAHYADRVAVMYAGRLVEVSPVREFFDRPRHPYSLALIRAATFGVGARASVEGGTSSPAAEGCPYAPRCPLADELCRTVRPLPTQVGEAALVSCHHSEKVPAHAAP